MTTLRLGFFFFFDQLTNLIKHKVFYILEMVSLLDCILEIDFKYLISKIIWFKNISPKGYQYLKNLKVIISLLSQKSTALNEKNF